MNKVYVIEHIKSGTAQFATINIETAREYTQTYPNFTFVELEVK